MELQLDLERSIISLETDHSSMASYHHSAYKFTEARMHGMSSSLAEHIATMNDGSRGMGAANAIVFAECGAAEVCQFPLRDSSSTWAIQSR